MTNEEAIKILEYPVKKWSMEWDEREDGLSYYEALDMAISALRQKDQFREVTKKVEPLTLDELRQMDGEPLWVQFLHNKIGCCDLIGCYNSEFIRFYQSGLLLIDEYGKTWIAYRQKPEEDKHESN